MFNQAKKSQLKTDYIDSLFKHKFHKVRYVVSDVDYSSEFSLNLLQNSQ